MPYFVFPVLIFQVPPCILFSILSRAAALRLVQNWSLRRQVFGEDYWLKSMRLQNGAMHPNDVALLRTGAFALLTPPNPHQQRQTFVADFGRLQGLEQGTARQRLMFYIMITCLNDFSQRHGVDGLVIVNGRGMKVKHDNGRMIQASHTKTAFYINRFILVRDPTDQRTTLKHLYEKMMLAMVQKFWGNKLVTVAEESPENTRVVLEKVGLHSSTFPTQLGGDWSYDSIDKWIMQRLQIEGAVLSIPNAVRSRNRTQSFIMANVQPKENTTIRPSQPTTKTKTNPSFKKRRRSEVSTGSGNGPKTEEEKVQEAREKSAYYSRLSYYRKKEERQELAAQCEQLKLENKRLRIERQRLESLVNQAQTLVASNVISYNYSSNFFGSFFKSSPV